MAIAPKERLKSLERRCNLRPVHRHEQNFGPDGPVIGRIYKEDFSPSGTPWFWGLLIFPPMAARRGTAETREAAMLAFKAQWQQVRRR